MVVGSPQDDDGSKSGSVYGFFNDGSGGGDTLWPQAAEFTAPDAAAGDRFGFCVASEVPEPPSLAREGVKPEKVSG
jgi:hypothetical protein